MFLSFLESDFFLHPNQFHQDRGSFLPTQSGSA